MRPPERKLEDIMRQPEPKPGDIIRSTLSDRIFRIEEVWVEGYFKCKSLELTTFGEFEFINVDAIKSYWENLGQIEEGSEAYNAIIAQPRTRR